MNVLMESAILFWDWKWLMTVLVSLLSYLVVRFYHKVSKYPPGPFPLPVVGNLPALWSANALHKMADNWCRKYGDPITLWRGEKPMVILNTYKVVKEAFIEKRHEFSGRFLTKMAKLEIQGGHNVIFEDYNPTWKALRKITLTAVRKYAVSDSLETLCCEVVDGYVDSLKDKSTVVDSRIPFTFMVYNIIGMSLFGAKFDKEKLELAILHASETELIEASVNGLPSEIFPWLGPLYREREKKMELNLEEYSQILASLHVQAVRSYVSGNIESFTHSILAARDEAIDQEKNDVQYLTDANVFQVVKDVFIAATDTISEELQWLCLAMTRKPEIQERIKKEIETTLGQDRPKLRDRERLPYTVACILETLRMYPVSPLGIPHKTSCDTAVGGQFIPKDTGLLYNTYAINHDSDLWADPEVFWPERFLDTATGKVKQELLPQLMTFGLGPRTCPGEKMAHVDMFYILVRFMQRVTCSAPAGKSSTAIGVISSNTLLLPAVQDIVLTRTY